MMLLKGGSAGGREEKRGLLPEMMVRRYPFAGVGQRASIWESSGYEWKGKQDGKEWCSGLVSRSITLHDQ